MCWCRRRSLVIHFRCCLGCFHAPSRVVHFRCHVAVSMGPKCLHPSRRPLPWPLTPLYPARQTQPNKRGRHWRTLTFGWVTPAVAVSQIVAAMAARLEGARILSSFTGRTLDDPRSFGHFTGCLLIIVISTWIHILLKRETTTALLYDSRRSTAGGEGWFRSSSVKKPHRFVAQWIGAPYGLRGELTASPFGNAKSKPSGNWSGSTLVSCISAPRTHATVPGESTGACGAFAGRCTPRPSNGHLHSSTRINGALLISLPGTQSVGHISSSKHVADNPEWSSEDTWCWRALPFNLFRRQLTRRPRLFCRHPEHRHDIPPCRSNRAG